MHHLGIVPKMNAADRPFHEIVQERLEELRENPFSFATKTGLSYEKLRGVLRPDARRSDPKIETAKEICAALGLELYIGPPRSPDAAPTVPQVDFLKFAEDAALPQHGMAKCSAQGWAGDSLKREDLPRPAWIADDSAFWVVASGWSMLPEGIKPGDFCLVSPGRPPRVGDRVWIKEATNDRRVSIKRLTRMSADRAVVRGWLPAQQGRQQSFDEERPLAGIAELFPVVGVYRGSLRPGGVDVDFVADPREATGPRADGIVPVAMVEGLWPPKIFPSVLGFPEVWLSAQGLKLGEVALVGLLDDHFAPTAPKGSVALIDTSRRVPQSKGIYAIRRGAAVQVRRIEALKEGELLLMGDSPESSSEIIRSSERGDLEVLGAVVWLGHKLG